MDKLIHRENLALFRKRLAETPDDATRQVHSKLLTEEEAKEPPSQARDLMIQ
jgi:hypothetical protein